MVIQPAMPMKFVPYELVKAKSLEKHFAQLPLEEAVFNNNVMKGYYVQATKPELMVYNVYVQQETTLKQHTHNSPLERALGYDNDVLDIGKFSALDLKAVCSADVNPQLLKAAHC